MQITHQGKFVFFFIIINCNVQTITKYLKLLNAHKLFVYMHIHAERCKMSKYNIQNWVHCLK